MKPSVKGLIISLAVNTIGFLINMISYFTSKTLLLSIPMSGGEWSGQAGFGLMLNHTYPMTSAANQEHGRIWIQFEPVTLFVTIVIVFVISYIILKIISIKAKKNK